MKDMTLFKEVSSRRKDFLAEWLFERQLDIDLSEEKVGSDTEESTTPLTGIMIRPYDTNVVEGQIRLMPYCEDRNRLLYVLVLRKEEDVVMVASFSRYGAPACTTEWLTDFEANPIKVLEFFNVHPATVEYMSQSWVTGEMPPEKLAIAQTIYQGVLNGKLAESERENVGLPIYDLDDPRLAYMEEENALMSPFRASVFDCLNDSQEDLESPMVFDTSVFKTPFWDWSSERLAAGSEENDVDVSCKVDSFAERLTLAYSPHEGKLRLCVYDAAGEEESLAFDGWVLVGSDGSDLGTIANGLCVVEVPRLAVGAFALRDPEGKLHALGLAEELP